MRRKKTKLERPKKCGNCGIQITDSRYLRKRPNGATWCAWCANPKLRCLTLRQRRILQVLANDTVPNTILSVVHALHLDDDYCERHVEQELEWMRKQGLVCLLGGSSPIAWTVSGEGRRVLGGTAT